MTDEDLVHYNVHTFLNQYRDEFEPPVSLKSMFNSQLAMIFLKGPNERDDFHLEEGEEIFYMMEGEMNLKIIVDNKFRDIRIKKGEIFVLPARVRHSPRRPINSFGFVIEMKRLKNQEADALLYYDETKTDVQDPIHEQYAYIGEDFYKDVKELVKNAKYNYSIGNVTSKQAKQPKRLVIPDEHVKITEPISLESFIQDNEEHITCHGYIHIFKDLTQSKILVLGKGEHNFHNESRDVIFWIYRGNVLLHKGTESLELKVDDFYLLKAGIKATLVLQTNSFVIQMEMTRK